MRPEPLRRKDKEINFAPDFRHVPLGSGIRSEAMRKTNFHTHTARCGHAAWSDEEYVLSALRGGFCELGFSDHTPWPYPSGFVSPIRMTPDELDGYVASVRRLAERYRDRIRLRVGLECEYFDAYMPWLRETIRRCRLDYVLFGNHYYPSDEHAPYFGHETRSPEMLERYTESAVEGMETGLFACLAHPDLFMRSYAPFDGHCERASRRICRTAARLRIPLEYNVSMIAADERRRWQGVPHPGFWQIAADEGCTAVIGMDAHDHTALESGVYYDLAVRTLAGLNIPTVDTLPFFEY